MQLPAHPIPRQAGPSACDGHRNCPIRKLGYYVLARRSSRRYVRVRFRCANRTSRTGSQRHRRTTTPRPFMIHSTFTAPHGTHTAHSTHTRHGHIQHRRHRHRRAAQPRTGGRNTRHDARVGDERARAQTQRARPQHRCMASVLRTCEDCYRAQAADHAAPRAVGKRRHRRAVRARGRRYKAFPCCGHDLGSWLAPCTGTSCCNAARACDGALSSTACARRW